MGVGQHARAVIARACAVMAGLLWQRVVESLSLAYARNVLQRKDEAKPAPVREQPWRPLDHRPLDTSWCVIYAVTIGIAAIGVRVAAQRIRVATVGIRVAAIGIGVAAQRIRVAAIGIRVATQRIRVATQRIRVAAIGIG